MTPRPPTDPNSPRYLAKALLRDVRATMATLTLPSAGEAAGLSADLIRAYASEAQPNLPTSDSLAKIAGYLDSAAAELRAHAVKLRRQAKAIEREQQV